MYSNKENRGTSAAGRCSNCDLIRSQYDLVDARLDEARNSSDFLKRALNGFLELMHSLGEKAIKRELDNEDVKTIDVRLRDLKTRTDRVLEACDRVTKTLWKSMDLPPESDRVVVVRFEGEAPNGRKFRLAYYYRPPAQSNEIGNKIPYWKWYENDIGFLHTDKMKWKKI